MRRAEYFRMAGTSLAAHKMRSILTTLGIIIGVATVIAMMSIINGVNGIVEGELDRIGANVFFLSKYPAVRISFDWRKYRKRPNITRMDAKGIIEKTDKVSLTSPQVYKMGYTVHAGDKSTDPNVSLLGGDEAFLRINGLSLKEGRFFLPQEVLAKRNVCILGTDVVERIFPFRSPIGRNVRVGADQFQVVGILEERGAIFGESQDNLVLVPIGNIVSRDEDFEDMSIAVQAAPGVSVPKAVDAVRSVMRIRHKLKPNDPDDFEINTRDSIMTSYQNMTGSIFVAAIGIAAISLLVGGIGIMNIMLVSVKERTREIGIRKSLGARRKDIRNQFLVEAVTLSVTGGVLGVLFAVGGLQITTAYYSSLPMKLEMSTIILAVVFSAFVGIFFGVWPARRAAAMDPIECLRYE